MDKKNLPENVVYNHNVKTECLWRLNPNNQNDVKRMDELIKNINSYGYSFKYKTDLTNRNISDPLIFREIDKAIGSFDDEGISAELIGVIGKKGNFESSEIIIKNFTECSPKNRKNQAVFYDNAIFNIKDRRFEDIYSEWIQNEETAVTLPLTVTLLAKWKNQKTKKTLIKYLSSDNTDLVFIAIDGLEKYVDKDVIPFIFPLENHPNKDIGKFAEKTINKIDK